MFSVVFSQGESIGTSWSSGRTVSSWRSSSSPSCPSLPNRSVFPTWTTRIQIRNAQHIRSLVPWFTLELWFGPSLPKFHPEMYPSHVSPLYVQLSQGLTFQKWKTRSGLLKHELSVLIMMSDNQTVVFTLTFFDARYVRFLAGNNLVAENLSIRMDSSWMTFLSNSSRLVLAGD